jgi:hypothetical protein
VVVYTRSEAQRHLLLCYVLVVAVLAEGCVLAPHVFDELKDEIRMKAPEMAAR